MPATKPRQAPQSTRGGSRPSVADGGSRGALIAAVGHRGPNATNTSPCTALTAHADAFRDLLASLTALHERIRTLTALAAEKLAALRTADVHAIEELAQQETTALESLQLLDTERRAVLARLAQLWPSSAAAELKLDEIASRMPEPFSSQIRAKSEGLRSAAGALQQKNRLLATVARTLHSHIRGVFADLSNDTQETLVYGRTGQHEKHTAKRWVDAVG